MGRGSWQGGEWDGRQLGTQKKKINSAVLSSSACMDWWGHSRGAWPTSRIGDGLVAHSRGALPNPRGGE